MHKPRILETTLRDGSYVVNFQITAADTARIGRALEEAGFDLIEIGHGVGLGASEAGHGQAAESDERYMEAAAENLKSADWGMFCIPGIATLEQVDRAAAHGMKFLRVGTEVSRAADAQPFIERAKSHGMYVAANFMKSYVMPPPEFAETVKLSASYGADIVYLVDSAGGMLPDEIEGYFKAIQEVTDTPIGFHGHNNLGLAVATALRAAECGAAVVDTSLQGFGRSAGNTPTEQFVSVMMKRGADYDFDLVQLLDIGETYVKPLIEQRGLNSLDIVAGHSLFHTSYMKVIREFADKYQVDPRRLIMAVCAEDKVNAPRDLVERKARELSDAHAEVYTARYHFERYHGAEQS